MLTASSALRSVPLDYIVNDQPNAIRYSLLTAAIGSPQDAMFRKLSTVEANNGCLFCQSDARVPIASIVSLSQSLPFNSCSCHISTCSSIVLFEGLSVDETLNVVFVSV